jgi:ATP-dependent RNA helicase DeaD
MPFPTLPSALAQALAARDYTEPTPVQAAVLEQAGGERDMLVSAQTGSGKTVAYGLAFASTLLGEAERLGPPAAPLALVIAPTRELAMQVHGELAWLYENTGARIVTCIGGTDARMEQRRLAAGCHIVVGTPGRLRDHLERRQLDPTALRVVVLDEADEMLDLGFREDLEFLLDAVPDPKRTLLFSATIARDIVTLAKRYQRDAVRIDTVRRNEPHEDIEYRAMRVAGHELDGGVANVLRYIDSPASLVFCATRDGVRRMYHALARRGFAAVALSGELSQTDRTDALQALRDGRARVCVATDVAARGLDLPDLGLVIHADLPTSAATLLHRSGRTGRAGRKGVCVLLVPASKRRRAEQLILTAGIAATWSGAPSAEEIRARDQQRLLEDPVLTTPATEEELVLARTLLEGRSPEDLATALIRVYRGTLPTAETLADSGLAVETRSNRQATERSATRVSQGPMGWFRMNLGRRDKADPKWLIPLLCRVGGLTKADIGTIQVFDQETRFQITDDASARFQAAAAASDQDLGIAPVGNAPEPAGTRPYRPRAAARDGAPEAKRPWRKKPYAA